MKRIAIGAALVALIGAAGWFGYQYWRPASAPAVAPGSEISLTAPEPVGGGDVVTVDDGGTVDPNQGATPMAQRVAVLGFLNKRNGVSRDLTLKPGQAVKIGDAIVRLRACERTAPWEQEPLTGAFVQLDVQQIDKSWRRVFSGWTYKERPALNVVQHPVYDVWAKSCTMTFPVAGPESDKMSAAPAPSRSSAPKSPAAPDAAAPSSATPDSATPSNAT